MKTEVLTSPVVEKDSFQFSIIHSIPSEPKIPLKNYLLNLITDSDGKESSLYLKGAKEFIQEIWGDIVRNNWKKLKVRQFILEKLRLHPGMLYCYKNGKKAILIQNLYKLINLWKEYCQRTEKEAKEKWDEIYAADYTFSVHKYLQPTKLPKEITPKLSYFIGWICGDGHLTSQGNHYLVSIVDKSVDQLRYVLKPLITELFNIDPPYFYLSR